tara:strand:- start:6274 stop:8076 length:1803 start_codon:yes stop_codon:yes gene_type:complete
MLSFFKSVKILTTKKQLLSIYLLFFGGFLSMLLESVGLGLIGVYVAILSDPEIIINKIPFNNIKFYLEELSKYDLIILLSVILVIVFVIKNIYGIIYLYFEQRVSRSIIVSNSEKLLDIYLQRSYLFFVKNNPQKLVNNINHVLKLGVSHIFYAILLFREFVLISILFISFIFVSWKISLSIFFILAFISFLIYFFVKKKLTKLGEIIISSSQLILKILNENFRSIKLIKILKNYGYIIKQLSSNLFIRETNHLKHGIYQKIPRSVLEVFAVLLITIITYFLMKTYDQPSYFLPLLATLSLILIRMVPSFANLNFAISNLKYTSPAHINLINDLNKTKNKDEDFHNNIIASKNEKNLDFIELNKNTLFSIQNLIFYYDNSQNKILDNISLEFNTNQIIGFVGKSGSGKTTLVDIIIGLLLPSDGKIYINQKQANLFNSDSWQKMIGYVPQDVFLNNSTIKENIAYGLDIKDIEDKKIYECLKKANIFDFVNTLPSGINTIIKDLGVNLSGGQKQRLGIARALYNKPKILVLDEATSALDESNEQSILRNLKSMINDLTIIIIAHKHSTIKYCDKVFLLDSGRIISSGKPENLLKNLKEFD